MSTLNWPLMNVISSQTRTWMDAGVDVHAPALMVMLMRHLMCALVLVLIVLSNMLAFGNMPNIVHFANDDAEVR